ncbi:MAG: hypothetical protein WCL22_04985 [bacterium]
MRLRYYFTAALCLFAGIASAATKSKDKEIPGEEPTNLRFAWWEMPKNAPELYVIDGNEKLSVNAYAMAMSNIIKFKGQHTIELVRKVASSEVGKDGKPLVTYVPFLSINFEEIKSKEIAVLLFPNEAKGTCQYKLFDFSNEAFPGGSFFLINYSKAKLDCTVEDKTFSALPGQKTQCPTIFDERVAAYVAIGVTEPDGTKNLILSTKLIFSKYFRKLYFVTEKKEEDRKEYIIHCIDDASVLPATDESSSGDSSETKKSKKTAKQGA